MHELNKNNLSPIKVAVVGRFSFSQSEVMELVKMIHLYNKTVVHIWRDIKRLNNKKVWIIYKRWIGMNTFNLRFFFNYYHSLYFAPTVFELRTQIADFLNDFVLRQWNGCSVWP